MKLLSRTSDTAAALAKTRAELEAAAVRIADLGRKRQEAIESDVDLAGVLAIDRKLEDERRLRGILGERIVYLEAQFD
jgi:hypothetical protein